MELAIGMLNDSSGRLGDRLDLARQGRRGRAAVKTGRRLIVALGHAIGHGRCTDGDLDGRREARSAQVEPGVIAKSIVRILHHAAVLLEHLRLGEPAEVLGDFGICEAVVGRVILVAYRRIGPLVDEGSVLVRDAHDEVGCDIVPLVLARSKKSG